VVKAGKMRLVQQAKKQRFLIKKRHFGAKNGQNVVFMLLVG
jgi:hypothetical protein